MAAALGCGLSGAAFAHHSAAPVFDLDSEKTVTGAVTLVEWTNPHIWVYVDVQNASGPVEKVAVEGRSPDYLAGGGGRKKADRAGGRRTLEAPRRQGGESGGSLSGGRGRPSTLRGGGFSPPTRSQHLIRQRDG